MADIETMSSRPVMDRSLPDQNAGASRDARVTLWPLALLGDLMRQLHASPDTSCRLAARATLVAAQLAMRTRRRRPRLDVSGRSEPAHPEDLALAAHALAGDARAVDEVRLRVEGIVIGRIYAAGLAWNEDELLELVMDRVWDKLALYRGQSSLRTWAWTVASNFLRNWKRDARLGRLRTVSLEHDVHAATDVPAPPDFAPDFPVGMEEHERRARQLLSHIERVASEQLHPDEWELIQRVVMRGEHYATISGEQHELPATLRARVFRALCRLREPLRKELGQEVTDYFADD